MPQEITKTTYENVEKTNFDKIKSFLKENFYSLVGSDWDLQNYYTNKLFDLFGGNYDEERIKQLLDKIEYGVNKAVDEFVKSGYVEEIGKKLGYKKIYVRNFVRTEDVYLCYPIFYKIHLRRKLAKYILENGLYDLSKVEIYIGNYGTYWRGSEPYKYEVLNLTLSDKGEYKIEFNF